MTREYLLDLIERSLAHSEERGGCPAMAVLDALDAAGALRDEETALRTEEEIHSVVCAGYVTDWDNNGLAVSLYDTVEAARDAALAEVRALREALEECAEELEDLAQICWNTKHHAFHDQIGRPIAIDAAAKGARELLSTPASVALAGLLARVRDAALEAAAVKIETDGAKEAEERMHKAAEEGKDQLADGYAGAGVAAKYYARAIRAMKEG